MEPAQREALLPILAAARDMTVATLRADGYPQATIVSYVNEGLAICFGSGGNSPETADIAGDDRISAAIASPHARWSEIRARSRAIAKSCEQQFPARRRLTFRRHGGDIISRASDSIRRSASAAVGRGERREQERQWLRHKINGCAAWLRKRRGGN